MLAFNWLEYEKGVIDLNCKQDRSFKTGSSGSSITAQDQRWVEEPVGIRSALSGPSQASPQAPRTHPS